MNIGENLKILREQKKLSQEQLAEQVGINRSMIAQIERGSKSMTLPLSVSIASVLCCTLDELAFGLKR